MTPVGKKEDEGRYNVSRGWGKYSGKVGEMRRNGSQGIMAVFSLFNKVNLCFSTIVFGPHYCCLLRPSLLHYEKFPGLSANSRHCGP